MFVEYNFMAISVPRHHITTTSRALTPSETYSGTASLDTHAQGKQYEQPQLLRNSGYRSLCYTSPKLSDSCNGYPPSSQAKDLGSKQSDRLQGLAN